MSVPFTGFVFQAQGAPTSRTLPARLSEVVNALNWGADPTGGTDSTAALQAAIDFAYTLNGSSTYQKGATLFIPRGTYLIGSPPLFVERRMGDGQGGLEIVGAGREATILTGNYSGYLVKKSEDVTAANDFDVMAHLTIRNESTAAGSGAFRLGLASRQSLFLNCQFVGVIGLICEAEAYGPTFQDCVFVCSAPIAPANSANPGPLAGSCGIFPRVSAVINCYAVGFDVGFGMNHFTCLIGCSASRCNTGVRFGYVVTPATVSCGAFLSNRFDRCKRGIECSYAGAIVVAGNVVSGDTGPADPAPIQGITWSGGTANATTVDAHNLPVRPTKLVLVTHPAGWTPRETGNEIVSCTRTGSNTFTYSLAASPESFTSATWNYPLEYAIISSTNFQESAWIANVMSAVVSQASFDSSAAGQRNSVCISMLGPYGWVVNSTQRAGTNYISCGGTLNPPFGFMQFAFLPGQPGVIQPRFEGQEYNIANATAAGFAGTVAGGGTNHYKIRFDGANWIRVG